MIEYLHKVRAVWIGRRFYYFKQVGEYALRRVRSKG